MNFVCDGMFHEDDDFHILPKALCGQIIRASRVLGIKSSRDIADLILHTFLPRDYFHLGAITLRIMRGFVEKNS